MMKVLLLKKELYEQMKIQTCNPYMMLTFS